MRFRGHMLAASAASLLIALALVCISPVLAADSPFASRSIGQTAAYAATDSAQAAAQTSATRVDIDATVKPDGSMDVVERRAFACQGKTLSVAWPIERGTSSAGLSVSSVRYAPVDSEGNPTGEWQDLPKTTFLFKWRTDAGPQTGSYALDRAGMTLYLALGGDESGQAASDQDATSSQDDAATQDAASSQDDAATQDAASTTGAASTQTSFVVELSYTLSNNVTAYKDVGELWWKYVGSGWAFESDDVELSVHLPMPEGVEAAGQENVWAWGHGPGDGVFRIDADGTVFYSTGMVRKGQFAEVRIEFPVGWLYDVSDEQKAKTSDTRRLQDALADEEGWSDQGGRWRVADLSRAATSVFVSIVVLMIAVLLYLTTGKEHKPDFTGDYWRDVPRVGEAPLHPSLAGRLWRWGHPSRVDLVAAVFHLWEKGVVGIDQDASGASVRIHLPAAREEVGDEIDERAFRLLLDVARGGKGDMNVAPTEDRHVDAAGEAGTAGATSAADTAGAECTVSTADTADTAGTAGTVSTADIAVFAAARPHAFIDGVGGFQRLLDERQEDMRFFDERSRAAQRFLVVAALVLGFGGIALSLVGRSLFPAASAVPAALGTFVLGNYSLRRTPEGNNLVARCKAFRNWVSGFETSGETFEDAGAGWREMLPYALVFQVGERLGAGATTSEEAEEVERMAACAASLQSALDAAMRNARKIVSGEHSSFGATMEEEFADPDPRDAGTDPDPDPRDAGDAAPSPSQAEGD